jgi:hypothetical protein
MVQMKVMSRSALVGIVALVVGSAPGPSLAHELAGQTDRDCDESLGDGQAEEPSPPQVEAAPEVPAPPPPWPAASVPVPPAPTETSIFIAWPVEYVLRPQTLPARVTEVGALARAFRPQSGELTTASGMPYTFHSTLTLGLWARTGLTDRVEVGMSAPRVFCLSRAEPSGCNEINRYNGTGPSLSYGLLRARAVQFKLFAGLEIVRSSMPMTWAWIAGGRAKILMGTVLAVEMALSFDRRISPGASEPKNATNASSILELNLQAKRRLNLFAGLNPFAPLDHLGEAALALWGGAAWTFKNLSEVVAAAGTHNVLANRAWSNSVPGTFYTLSLLFWF